MSHAISAVQPQLEAQIAEGPTKYSHGYNLGPFAVQLQSIYDDHHNNIVVGMTRKAQQSNEDLSLLTDVLTRLYTELKNNPDDVIDLTDLQPAIDLLRDIYSEIAEANQEEFRYYDSNCPFPENIEDLRSDDVREIAQKLESLRTRMQGELPQLMTRMQEAGQLLLAIVEILRELTKSIVEETKHTTNNMSRG
ncbi:MAG: hypothetical protein KAR79_06100 [Simkaniaceae bacterium]|nr:hypothetical protein [Simkaniaceae bacterium]